jgi:RNA polymerase sigma factor (sigma-70 family)
MICDERRNILAARPYFRERQPVFTKSISKALKSRDEKALQKFHFNYTFVTFVLRARKWPKGSQIVKLSKEIAAIRQEIVEMNMPLAISRASIFWRKTPKAQLSYMDLVQIACEGLMSAVDKFCLPFSRVFRAVAIGRMLGNFIEQYSETLVHFYPGDKRKIYRANKMLKHFPDGVDFDQLAAAVNKEADTGQTTTPAEIADLLAAASCVSTDSSAPNDPEESEVLDTYVADVSAQPDYQYEQYQMRQVLSAALEQLTPMERKLLKMKGISL